MKEDEVWPMSTTRAARKLGLPMPTVCTLITGCRIRTIRISNANCLDREAFAQLEAICQPFLNRPRRRRRRRRDPEAEPEPVGS